MPYTILTDRKYIDLNNENIFKAFLAISSTLQARGLYIFVKNGKIAFHLLESEIPHQTLVEIPLPISQQLTNLGFQITEIEHENSGRSSYFDVRNRMQLQGDDALYNLLVKHGADPTLADGAGKTPNGIRARMAIERIGAALRK